MLVDCSTSMAPYLPAITGIMSRFAGGSRRGDSFTCYQFSSNPILIARKKLEKPGDVGKLRAQIQQLRLGENSTNFTPAIERAMADVRVSLSARPSNERVLLLITDGRRHRQDIRSEKRALRELLKSHSDMKAGRDYSFYCFYIGNWFETDIERDLQEYLLSSGVYLANWPEDRQWLEQLSIADIRIMDRTAFLGDFPDVPEQGSFSIAFYPRRPSREITMVELRIKANFPEKTLDRFFTISPRRFICKEEPWEEKFTFETRGFAKGDYAGTFHFRPTEPQALLLSPRPVDFSFTVLGVLQVNIPTVLMFGPTGLRGEYSETRQISITANNAYFPGSANAISVAADIELPEGVRLELSKTMKGKEINIEITVSRDQAIAIRDGGKYEGKIALTPKPGWTLTQDEIAVSVDVAARSVDTGAVALYSAVVVGFIIAIVGFVLAFENVRTAFKDYLAKKTAPIGKLVVIADPTKGVARNINLERLAEKNQSREIKIGAAGGVHVDLPHISMIDKTYTFSGRKAGDAVHTVIEAGKSTDEVVVNAMSRTGEVHLRHLDRVRLGAFEFIYEIPRLLKQVILYYLSGEVVEGWLLSWNIDAEGFHFMSREDDPRQKEKKESYARFYELKALAFVRDFDGELTRRLLSLDMPQSGHRVRIFLADQEELVGYVLNWKKPREKFYLFPESMGDNIMFFVIEKNTIRDMSLLQEDDRGAERARKKLAQVLGEMKKEVAG